MKKFAEFNVGDEFFSTCSISEKELSNYLDFSKIKNVFLEKTIDKKLVSGRAILARIEGEFTRLEQVYGNQMIFIGTDGDAEWANRNTRFLKPLYTDEILKIKFVISGKEDIDEDYGKIMVDFLGANPDNEPVVISKRNIYRIKK